MRFVETGLQKNYDRQKKSIMEQIQSANIRCLDIVELDADDAIAKEKISIAAVKNNFGKLLRPDYWQVYVLEGNHIYVQPFAGTVILPGEHHLYLHGEISHPILLKASAQPIWTSPNQAFANHLNQLDNLLKYAVRNIEFEWPIGNEKITQDWAVHVYSTGNGTSKLIMKTGRYGGIMSYDVGFPQLNALVNGLESILEARIGNHQIALKTGFYRTLVDYYFEKPTIVVETGSQKSHAEIIQEFVSKHVGKQIFSAHMPRKKEKGFKKYIVPADYSNDHILAAFDTTAFRSCKTGLVFTETHCFVKSNDMEAAFELDDLVAVTNMEPDANNCIEIMLIDKKMMVPVGPYGKELAQLFVTLS